MLIELKIRRESPGETLRWTGVHRPGQSADLCNLAGIGYNLFVGKGALSRRTGEKPASPCQWQDRDATNDLDQLLFSKRQNVCSLGAFPTQRIGQGSGHEGLSLGAWGSHDYLSRGPGFGHIEISTRLMLEPCSLQSLNNTHNSFFGEWRVLNPPQLFEASALLFFQWRWLIFRMGLFQD